MTEDRRQDADNELFDDIQRDCKKSEIKITKLLKADQSQQKQESHHARKPQVHQTLFTRRHHMDPVDGAKLNDPANGSNTFPRHGLSV